MAAATAAAAAAAAATRQQQRQWARFTGQWMARATEVGVAALLGNNLGATDPTYIC